MTPSRPGQSTFRKPRGVGLARAVFEDGPVHDAVQEREDHQRVVQALLHGLDVDHRVRVQHLGLDRGVGVLEDAVQEEQVRPESLQVPVFRVGVQGPVQHLLDFEQKLLVRDFRKEVHDRHHDPRVEHDGGPSSDEYCKQEVVCIGYLMSRFMTNLNQERDHSLMIMFFFACDSITSRMATTTFVGYVKKLTIFKHLLEYPGRFAFRCRSRCRFCS